MKPWSAGESETPRSVTRDSDVLSWWTDRHDGLIAAAIERDPWSWILDPNDIVAITSTDVLAAWRQRHEARSPVTWYGYLAWFARGRAKELGLSQNLPPSEVRPCERCGRPFLESSIRPSLVDRVGADVLIFCGPCLGSFVYPMSGADGATAEEILRYMTSLSNVLGRLPRQDFGERLGDLDGLTRDERLALLRVLSGRPSVARVKMLFGSWKAAANQSAHVRSDDT